MAITTYCVVVRLRLMRYEDLIEDCAYDLIEDYADENKRERGTPCRTRRQSRCPPCRAHRCRERQRGPLASDPSASEAAWRTNRHARLYMRQPRQMAVDFRDRSHR